MRKQIKPKAQVVFLLLTIFVIMVSLSSVSAAPLPTASQVYVSTNGSDVNSGTVDSPYFTIQKGVDSISENGTVYIANGIYNGTGNTNITISKNMNITGQSQAGTLINGTGTNWIFNIQSGVTVNINNLTFTNATALMGATIYNDGALNVTTCTFTNNAANNDAGGAIFNGGTLNIIQSIFTGNYASWYGGAIMNFGLLTVINSTLTNNSALGHAGAIMNSGQLTVINSTLTNNSVTSFGGAIANDGTVSIINSIINNNTAQTGGAIHSYGTNLSVTFSSVAGNTASSASAIWYGGTGMNATSNWWGSNDPVWADLLYGSVNTSTWLYMTINATKTVINNTQTSLVTVSFNNIYNGTAVTSIDPANGHIPDGMLVNFSNSTLGSFNPATVTTINGIATALFTANKTGTDNITATTNTQTVKQLLTVNPASYLYLNVTSSKSNPTVGEMFVLTYKLSNSGPDNATNVTMSFQIPAGLEFVSATVDNGTWSYNPANRTVTWTLSNVAVGDPYLYLTVRALGSGSYTITPTITSDTYNRNTDPLTPFTVNVQAKNNSNNTVNAATTTKTVPMQHTGMPVAGLILAILAIFGGMLPRRK